MKKINKKSKSGDGVVVSIPCFQQGGGGSIPPTRKPILYDITKEELRRIALIIDWYTISKEKFDYEAEKISEKLQRAFYKNYKERVFNDDKDYIEICKQIEKDLPNNIKKK